MLKVVSSRPQDIFNESDIELIRYLKELNGDSQQEKAELSRIVKDPRFELVRKRVYEDFKIIKSEHDRWKSRSYWGLIMFYYSPVISILISRSITFVQRRIKWADSEAKKQFVSNLFYKDELFRSHPLKKQLAIFSTKYSEYVNKLLPYPYEEYANKNYGLFQPEAFYDAWKVMMKIDRKTAISLCMMTMIFVSLSSTIIRKQRNYSLIKTFWIS